jgi:hypothetical protein
VQRHALSPGASPAKGGIHAKQLQAAWNEDYLLKALASGF